MNIEELQEKIQQLEIENKKLNITERKKRNLKVQYIIFVNLQKNIIGIYGKEVVIIYFQ